MDEVQSGDAVDHREGNYVPIRDTEDPHLGLFDKPLPCCGCGIGWCSFLLGFVFPVTWYFAAILYFVKYYHRDPRERSGLAACAIAILLTVAGLYMHIGCSDHSACYSVVILATADSTFPHPICILLPQKEYNLTVVG